MSNHVPGFSNFSRFLHHFVLANLATSSIRVKATMTVPTLPVPFALSLVDSKVINISTRCIFSA